MNSNNSKSKSAQPDKLRIVLCAINARYSHTSLSIRLLRQACFKKTDVIDEIIATEYTINDQPSAVLQKLYELSGDIYAFSCYVWNRKLTEQICGDLRKVKPDCTIIIGGPEAAWQPAEILEQIKSADIVLSGEGETNFPQIIISLNNYYNSCINKESGYYRPDNSVLSAVCEDISGISWIDQQGNVRINPVSLQLSEGEWPFPYMSEELSELSERILYYESSRGCPFGCTYCMSSRDRTVRYRPLDQVFSELELLMDANVKLVKFVDRTFNCNPKRSADIWKWLIDKSKTKRFRTRFHFEIAADLIDDISVEILNKAPENLFQFEIGVQSCSSDVLNIINRKCDLPLLFKRVEQLRALNTIHLHLDLIAGLPTEDLQQFTVNFDQVIALKPHMLQLGFLKILPGSIIFEQANSANMIWRDKPPYEILSSDKMSFADLIRLKRIENQLDCYYNSGKFELSINYLLQHEKSAFAFFAELADFYLENGWENRQIGRHATWELLRAFILSCRTESDSEILRDHLVLDYMRSGQKDLPDWQSSLELSQVQEDKLLLSQGKEVIRQKYPRLNRFRIEKFSCNPEMLLEGMVEKGKWLVAFDLSGKKPAKIWQTEIICCGKKLI